MGGFTLHEEGKPVRILEARELEALSEVGKIEWPTITEDEKQRRLCLNPSPSFKQHGSSYSASLGGYTV